MKLICPYTFVGVYGRLKTLIEEHAPNFNYVHCAVHPFILILDDSTKRVRKNMYFFDNSINK